MKTLFLSLFLLFSSLSFSSPVVVPKVNYSVSDSVIHDTVYIVAKTKKQERKVKRVYKKDGNKRSKTGKVVHEIFEILKLLIPFLQLL